MTDSLGGGDLNLQNALRRFLKDRQDFPVGPFQFGDVVALHLLGSIYSAGLAQSTDTWTVYPGSRRTSGANASLAPFIANAARLFRKSYVGDLLIRHTDALDSGQTRAQGGQVGFSNQINTVQLNPAHRRKIEGKRIVVVDDFETNGYSLECARNLLLLAGAASVTCIAIGKYQMRGQGYARTVYAPQSGYSWDPFATTTDHEAANFQRAVVPLETVVAAPIYFKDSYYRFRAIGE